MGRYLQRNEGGTAAEYAMMLAIVGAGIAASAVLLGSAISTAMNNASSTLAGSAASGSASASSSGAGGAGAGAGSSNAHGNNPNAGPGNNSGNGNTDPGGKKG